MKLFQVTLILTLVISCYGLLGCGGGGAKIEQTNTTLGRELQDLDSAHSQGLLSDKEYKSSRKDLIKKHTK